MSDGGVRFCPFCREPFEGLARCPSHDLALVPFSALGESDDLEQDQAPVSALDPRFGRGALMVASALLLLGFFLPLAGLSGPLPRESTAFALARSHHLRLWLVPMTALALLLVLTRRRSLTALRGARLSVMLLALVPLSAVLATLAGARSAAALLARQLRADVDLQTGPGGWLVLAASVLAFIAGTRLGVRPARRVR